MTSEEVVNLRWVRDRLEVEDIISRVTLNTDTRNYEASLQLYTDDAIMDYSALLGATLPVKEQRAKAMDFLPGFDATHHQITNFAITIDGDEATSQAQVRATHVIGEEQHILGGTYLHRLRRTPEGWRIYYHRFDKVFESGTDLFQKARERVASGKSNA